jgi:formylglycine-generating enzyme required for sulfatase activity
MPLLTYLSIVTFFTLKVVLKADALRGLRMENQSQLKSMLQEELNRVIASRESSGSEITETYERFLREKIKELFSNEGQTINIEGSVGPASVVGNGSSIQASVIAGGNVIFSDNEEEKAQVAEEDYLRTLIKINTRLFLGPLDVHAKYSSQNPDLARIYIPLVVIATVPIEGDAGDLLGKDRPLSVVEIISQHKHLTLLGDPGSGKSTVLKYLTWYLASMRFHDLSIRRKGENAFSTLIEKLPGWHDQPLLPVPISLPDLARWIVHLTPLEVPTLDSYLDYFLQAKLDIPDFSKYIHNYIRRGEVILFFDGLDEVTDLEARKRVILLLRQFGLVHPDTHIVVTCRALSYSNPTLQLGEDFSIHTLAGLTLEQAQQFIRNWYNLLIEKKELKREVALLRASNLERLVGLGLAEFRSTPLLLTVMVIVHASTGDLPREKARLYNQCCEILFWQWQQAKSDISGEIQPGIYDALGTRIVELRGALAKLAYNNHSRKISSEETSDISETDVIRTFRGFLGYDPNDSQGSAEAFKKAKLFLDYIQFQAGLLIAKGNSGDLEEPTYSFIHRTFQEFLAGYYLTTQRDLNRRLHELICSENSDQWYEVMRLAIGHMVFNSTRVEDAIDAAKFVFYAKYRTLAQERRAVWWAAEMLTIVGKERAEKDEVAGKNLLLEVRAHLSELLTEGNFPPRHLEAAGNSLSKIGDPRRSVVDIPPGCVIIPRGAFLMGVDESVRNVSQNEQPSNFIELEQFEISIYPITNAQFRAFINDGGYGDKHRDCWSEQGWRWRISQNWEYPEFIDDPNLGVDNKPVVGISWFEAISYVNWLSKQFNMRYRLPTEAEWERAARGVKGWMYPWGDIWQKNIANTSELGLDVPTAVGVFQSSNTKEGCADLIGNVWEWCQNLYAKYPYDANDGRENLDTEGPRILRGGSYQTSCLLSRCTYRMWRFPAYRNRYTGFRIVLECQCGNNR